MSNGQARLQWFGWLRAILASWVSAKVDPPQHVLAELGINPNIPVCYVLRSNSIFDFLMLDLYCVRMGLPRPLVSKEDLGGNKDAASVYLGNVGVLRTYGAYRNEPPSPFYKMLRRVATEPNFDVQMVPVSIFFGRDPGRSERSVLKLLFTDDERASFFQKAAIVFAHGRNAFISFSKPISLRAEFAGEANIDQTARKLTRVVRVHFQTKRISAMGPGLVSRNRVIETMIRGKALRVAIDEECKKKNIPRERAERLAKEYISEISAEIIPQMIAAAAIILRWMWNRIYRGIQIEHADRMRKLPANAEIVYVPCHRSHMDYLLLNYVLYDSGEVMPQVAAGINLNFWPVGSIMRRLGAFYIRRTFNNNRLYTVVFSEYVSFLLRRGMPIQFFLEGGRSRTGKILPAKTGMVAMVVQSYLRHRERPIYFIPVYLGYDNVVEVKTYRRELSGTKKRTESVGQLVKSQKVLRTSHGKAYISYGAPIDLHAYLSHQHPGWDKEIYNLDSKPSWAPSAIQALAIDIMTTINANAILSPVGLVALILHASRTKAMAEDELLSHIDRFLDIFRSNPYSSDARDTGISGKALLEYAEQYGKLSRFHHVGGDVLHLQEPQASYSLYYRNNVAHLFAVPSLMAFFLQHNDAISEDFLRRGCRLIYPVLKREFFLRWSNDEISGVIDSYLHTMKELGLFSRNERGDLTRADVTSAEFTVLRTLGLVVGPAIERYSVAIHLLHQYGGEAFKPDEFQTKCVLMAQRISLLTGTSDSELPSIDLFKSILEHLADEHYLERDAERGFRLTPSFESVFEVTSALLSVDIRHSMSRVRK